MSKVTARQSGDIVSISGPGFTFRKIGGVSKFEQRGKCPSLRAAKAICKALSKCADANG